MTTVSKRDQLVETALDLFYKQGFNATGIDKILAEAGVAKMTLYKHFKSKEELIQAVLRLRDERFREWLMGYVEQHADTPRDRLMALFDAHDEWFSNKGFRGCLFLNASAEFSRIAEPVAALASEHKRMIHAYVRGLASAAEARNPDHLADWLILLLDGAIGCAQVSANPGWASTAKQAAEILIDTALQKPSAA